MREDKGASFGYTHGGPTSEVRRAYDRHAGDPTSQAEATRRTQEITDAYRRIKDAVRHGEAPIRRPRAREPAPTHSGLLNVDTRGDRILRFLLGALLGLFLDLTILAGSAAVWIIVPVVCGVAATLFGGRVLEWA